MRTKKQVLEAVAIVLGVLMLSGCDGSLGSWIPGVDENTDRRWIFCKTGGPNFGVWSYRPEPEDGEVWKQPDGSSGVEHWHPYHYESCADIGESMQSACKDGCEEFVHNHIEATGLWNWWWGGTDYHGFDDDQGDWTLGHEHSMGITWYTWFIRGICSTAMFGWMENTHQTCSEENALLNAIRSTSINSDTYQGSAIEDDASQCSVLLTENIGESSSVTLALNSGEFKFGFGIPRTCETGLCSITIGEISGYVYDFEVTDGEDTVDITEAKFYLSGDVVGTYDSATNGFVIPSGEARFIFEYMFGSKYGNYVLFNDSSITGTIDLNTGVYTVQGSFSSSDEDVTLDMDITGNILRDPLKIRHDLA